jgi:hypothetical protein
MRRWLLGALAATLSACATQPVKPQTANDTHCSDEKVDPRGAVKSFKHRPKPGEKAICPVSGDVFYVTADTPIREYDGSFYAFCCDQCPNDFHPELGSPMVGGGEHPGD